MKNGSKRGSISFQKSSVLEILDWFKFNARPLPWRENKIFIKNPYAVWISEVMSQQSTLAMMTPFYLKWMKAFPTLKVLAEAPLHVVEPYWAGLGYYSRVRNLHAAAQILFTRLKKGEGFPQHFEDWLQLPGVGPYTAAAVTSICFDQKKIPIDGNVLRVFSRILAVPDPLNNKVDRERIESFLEDFAKQLPDGLAGAFAQALMDLGATICRPREAATCESCPLAAVCMARAQNQQFVIPLKKRRIPMAEIVSFMPIYQKSQKLNSLLLYQIPKGWRLSGQWSLPQWEILKEDSIKFKAQLVEKFEVFPKIHHTITTHRYHLYGVKAGIWPESKVPRGHKFFRLDELVTRDLGAPLLNVTTATRKILNFLVDSSS